MIKLATLAHPLTEIIRITVAITTAGALICLCLRYIYFAQWNKKYDNDLKTKLYYRYKESSKSDVDKYSPSIVHPFKNFNFISEFLVLSATPIPFLNFVIEHEGKSGYRVFYLIDDLVLPVMALRCYFLVRAVQNYSVYTDPY